MTPSFISAPSSFSLSYFMNELVKFSSSLKCVLQDFTERLSQIHSIFPSILISFFIYLFHFSFTHIDFLFHLFFYIFHIFIPYFFRPYLFHLSTHPGEEKNAGDQWASPEHSSVTFGIFICEQIFLRTNIHLLRNIYLAKYLFFNWFKILVFQEICILRNILNYEKYLFWEIFIRKIFLF